MTAVSAVLVLSKVLLVPASPLANEQAAAVTTAAAAAAALDASRLLLQDVCAFLFACFEAHKFSCLDLI
jgi:hypothetical protein